MRRGKWHEPAVGRGAASGTDRLRAAALYGAASGADRLRPRSAGGQGQSTVPKQLVPHVRGEGLRILWVACESEAGADLDAVLDGHWPGVVSPGPHDLDGALGGHGFELGGHGVVPFVVGRGVDFGVECSDGFHLQGGGLGGALDQGKVGGGCLAHHVAGRDPPTRDPLPQVGVVAQHLEEGLVGGRCGSNTPPSPAPTLHRDSHRAGCCGHGPPSDAGRPWPRVDFSAIPRAQRRTAPCVQALSARKLLALYATTDSHVLVLARPARIRNVAHRHCLSRTSVCGLRRQ